MGARTVFTVLEEAARAFGKAPALHQPIGKGNYRTYSWLEYQRAVVRWQYGRLVASPTGRQASSRLMNMIGANGLLEIPSGGEILPAGSRVTALLTGEIVDGLEQDGAGHR